MLSADPLEDIHNTSSIRYVMKNGELFEGDTLDEDLARPQAAAQALVVGGEGGEVSRALRHELFMDGHRGRYSPFRLRGSVPQLPGFLGRCARLEPDNGCLVRHARVYPAHRG